MAGREFQIDSAWKMRSCPACLSNSSKLLFRKEQVPYYECMHCATVYVNPLPPEQLLLSIYNQLGTDYFTNPNKLELDFQPSRFHREISMIPHAFRHGKLLDVGCSTGSFLMYALQQGFSDVCGIDISAAAVDYANKRIGLTAYVGDFLLQPFDSSTFDVVTMWATLEHVADPEAFVGEAWRILKNGGLLCLSVPNRNGLSMRVLRHRYHMVGLEHLNYFTPYGLRILLKRKGFVPYLKQTYAFNPLSFWKDLRSRHLSGNFSHIDLIEDQKRSTKLKKRRDVRVLQRILDRFLTIFEVGDPLLVTGRKP